MSRQGRKTGSLGLRSSGALRWLIAASRRTPLGPLETPQFHGTSHADGLAAGRTELADGASFFRHFDGRVGPADLRSQRVLDIGCGYGGRTVYYRETCGADHVVGVEPFDHVIERCRRLGEVTGASSVDFEVGAAEDLPFSDGSFDVVVSYDVLEHVQDPAAAIREIARVLRTTGRGFLVFPTYLGLRASHLDFATRLPGLHRIFDPDTIVDVIQADFPVSVGRPWQSPLGRYVLPNLNGMRRSDALGLLAAAGLQYEEIISPFVRATDPIPGARAARNVLERWNRSRPLPELLIGSLAFIVRPTGAGTRSAN